MKILLFGGTGFIGSHLKEGLEAKGHQVLAPRIEIRNFDEVRQTIEDTAPDYIINATGITGKPNVDWCENHPAETYSVNVTGSINIATAAFEKNIKVAQLSSGCVYDGDNNGKGFTEEDAPNYFGSLYSRTRVVSEMALKDFPNVLQLRVNIVNSCTVIEDFVPATIQLIEMGQTGIFNMTNIGAMDHKSIMSLYKEIVDPDFEINLMGEEEQTELCKRRSNDILNTDKREALGVHMPPLEESLRRILASYKKNLK